MILKTILLNGLFKTIKKHSDQSMAETLDIIHKDLLIPIKVIRHARARKIKLRISKAGGEVKVTIPPKLPLRKAQAFIHEHKNWIIEEFHNSVPLAEITSNKSFPFQGEEIIIKEDPSRRRGCSREGQILYVPSEDRTLIGSRVKRWLIQEARKNIEESLLYYASVMNLSYRSVSISDTKTRWGSCSVKGDLRFNFRLIMADQTLLDYVVVHELAHRVHMDHSTSFWALVEDFCPDYKTLRRALKDQAAVLQAFQF
ncbi:SprT family zinc-dependent metalloprotease [Temperatibacter marinus]|uniref:SprT family zinc-dependent metalloprotease n=1 Tax=Temperatibacter marinus TaxID=1456591 RepID=A0AA52EJV2_9PROT|nr:SprT family zinc-dependent metalloprotease [Temperatibacter marinus]WND04135.1 SprT family zinc-dependent metalloprotease [Temperatibacter marinus]